MATDDELMESVELARMASPFRSYPGTGGIWCGSNNNLADATFDDWGLARAVARIMNAVLDGTLHT
jgi:hypothetical protein